MMGDLARSPDFQLVQFARIIQISESELQYDVPRHITVLIECLICYCQPLQYRQAGVVEVVAKLRFGRFKLGFGKQFMRVYRVN
jgi:hypothetical protein